MISPTMFPCRKDSPPARGPAPALMAAPIVFVVIIVHHRQVVRKNRSTYFYIGRLLVPDFLSSEIKS